MRNWLPFYRTSVALGARYLLRHGYQREALLRVVIPLDPSRYLELPWAFAALSARPGERVLDLASPKLLDIALARSGAEVVSVDELGEEIESWRRLTAGEKRLRFQQADGRALPFDEASFDHVFVCFVLEHLPRPAQALRCLRRVLRPGGSITVIEGDNGSWYCHPETPAARRTVECQNEIAARLGGDCLIGRRVYPLLVEAGFQDAHVSPRMVYVDDSKPELVEGFSKSTFIAMVEGVREQALELGLIDEESWDRGIADMRRAAEPGGTFCYTFFKGTALA